MVAFARVVLFGAVAAAVAVQMEKKEKEKSFFAKFFTSFCSGKGPKKARATSSQSKQDKYIDVPVRQNLGLVADETFDVTTQGKSWYEVRSWDESRKELGHMNLRAVPLWQELDTLLWKLVFGPDQEMKCRNKYVGLVAPWGKQWPHGGNEDFEILYEANYQTRDGVTWQDAAKRLGANVVAAAKHVLETYVDKKDGVATTSVAKIKLAGVMRMLGYLRVLEVIEDETFGELGLEVAKVAYKSNLRPGSVTPIQVEENWSDIAELGEQIVAFEVKYWTDNQPAINPYCQFLEEAKEFHEAQQSQVTIEKLSTLSHH